MRLNDVMEGAPTTRFDLAAWGSALDKFGAVTHLSVSLYGADGQIIGVPAPVTPLYAVFLEHAYNPGLVAECVRQCLAQSIDHRPAVIVAGASGLAVVGTSLLIDGAIVGAAVAGYAVVDFCDSVAVARLARDGGVPFKRLWDVVRQQQPVPARRLILHGELLQVLGDTLLRETHRARQYEETAAELRTALAVKDEFLAVLSHELRSPLTPILGWAQILQSEDGAAQRLRGATVIERNARLQLRLVEDLLELTRTARGAAVLHLTVQSLGDALRAALDSIGDTARAKGVALHFCDSDRQVFLGGDRDRLQQIFTNVLSNALKFTPPGGSVKVMLEESGGRAVVRVLDTGEGIVPEFLPFVFEMFKQQEQGRRRTHGGLGIGLVLVKDLVEAHGGSVSIFSNGAGLGTEVTMFFPVVEKVPDSPAPVVARSSDVRLLHGVRALVVDDLEDMRDFIRLTLERHGAEVISAEDGIDALGALARERVQLVLCDLRMPRMDGFEFLRALERLEGPGHAPVIAVSALAGSADHLRSTAAGFEGHLNKPFDDDDLLAMVGAVLARRA
jgi:signal transduction histidine kinase